MAGFMAGRIADRWDNRLVNGSGKKSASESGVWIGAGSRAHRIGCRLAVSLLLISATAALTGCAEPFIVMAGGELAGEVSDPPVDWTDLNEEEIIQLETQPEDPYSVNIWMVGLGPDLYVATGDDPTNWTENIDENPDVRVRIRGVIYELEANRVTDMEEKLRIGMEYVRKFDVDEDHNWIQNGQLFRLDRR